MTQPTTIQIVPAHPGSNVVYFLPPDEDGALHVWRQPIIAWRCEIRPRSDGEPYVTVDPLTSDGEAHDIGNPHVIEERPVGGPVRWSAPYVFDTEVWAEVEQWAREMFAEDAARWRTLPSGTVATRGARPS